MSVLAEPDCCACFAIQCLKCPQRPGGDSVQGEILLNEALEFSRKLDHPIAGLRNAISLAELMAKTGRGAEVREVLESWLVRFAPGSETTALVRRAHALLEV